MELPEVPYAASNQSYELQRSHASLSSPFSGTSLGGSPLPVTRQVARCNRYPGGPIRLHNRTEWLVKTPLFNPSNQIALPTNKSQVST